MENKRKKYASIGLLAFVSACFLFVFETQPLQSDDMWYSLGLSDWISGRSAFPDLQAWFYNMRFHYLYDNMRLANIVFQLLIFLPRPVYIFIIWMGIPAMLALFLRLCDIRLTSFYAVSVVVLGFVFVLIWFEEMWFMDFAINYVWSSVLSLYLLYRWFGKAPRIGYGILLGAVTAAFHEGFGMPLLATTLLLECIFRQYRTRRHWAIIGGLLLGTLYLRLSPGALARMPESLLPDLSTCLSVLRFHLSFIIFLFVALLCLLRKKVRRTVSRPFIIAILSIELCVYAIHCMFNFSIRTGFFGNVCCLLGILYCAYKWYLAADYSTIVKRVLHLTLILSLAFMAVHFVVVCYMSYHQYRVYHHALEQYRKNPYKAYFGDVVCYEDAPFITLMRPRYQMFTSNWDTNFNNHVYVNKKAYNYDNTAFRLIPQQLRYITNEKGMEVSGTPGLRKYGNYYFIDADSMPQRLLEVPSKYFLTPDELIRDDRPYKGKNIMYRSGSNCMVNYGGTWTDRRFSYIRFTSEADGRDYFWIYVNDSYFRSLIKPIKAIKL